MILFSPGTLGQSYEGEISYAMEDFEITQRCGHDFIHLEGEHQITVAGAPCLPVDRIDVALPVDAKVLSVRVLEKTSMELDGIYNVMPCSKPLCISEPPPEDPLKKDPGIYEEDAYYPSTMVEQFHSWDLFGQDFVTLEIHPLQFNPVTGKLVLHNWMRFEVTWQEAASPVRETFNFSKKQFDICNRRLREIPVNPEDVETLPAYVPTRDSPLKPGQYEYVIITIPVNTWHMHFEKYADWRNQMGIPTTIVSTDWIYDNYPDTGDPLNCAPGKIRNFIIDANTTWGTVYFLIGGDAGYVPPHSIYLPSLTGIGLDLVPNDSFYSDIDDDWKCEVFVGRTCVRSYADIYRFREKVLNYEKSPPPEYGNTAFFMGFDLDPGTPGEETKEIIYDKWIPRHVDFTCEYDSEPGPHMADAFERLHEGQNLVNHIDHGSTYVMGVGLLKHDEYMHIGHAASFMNGTRYFNIFSIGCLCARFIESCIAEDFLWDDQGAVTFVGNTSFGGYMWGNPHAASFKFDSLWYKAIFNHGFYRAGEALASCKNEYDVIVGYEVDEYLFTGLILLGDPALHLWSADPGDLKVFCRPSVKIGPQYFPITVKSTIGKGVEDALVCIMNGREVYSVETTDASGKARLYIHPADPGEMTVTVTARNFRYHEGVVSIISR
jgi:hypothetical protein